MKNISESNFFALIDRMKYINRWGLMRSTRVENVQEHSHQTAVLAHALAVIGREHYGSTVDPGAVAAAALYHDASEILTGDLPTPVKYYNPEISAAYRKVESVSKNKLFSLLPEDLAAEYKRLLFAEEDNPGLYKYVKAADRLSAYIKCVEELKSGNTEFKKAHDQIKILLEETDMPELRHFIAHYMTGFTLTLDELD